jgi:hypothetical protein
VNRTLYEQLRRLARKMIASANTTTEMVEAGDFLLSAGIGIFLALSDRDGLTREVTLEKLSERFIKLAVVASKVNPPRQKVGHA